MFLLGLESPPCPRIQILSWDTDPFSHKALCSWLLTQNSEAGVTWASGSQPVTVWECVIQWAQLINQLQKMVTGKKPTNKKTQTKPHPVSRGSRMVLGLWFAGLFQQQQVNETSIWQTKQGGWALQCIYQGFRNSSHSILLAWGVVWASSAEQWHP